MTNQLRMLVRAGFVRSFAVILLIAAYATCTADSAGSSGVPRFDRTLMQTVQLRPGIQMTPRQYEQYRHQFEQPGRAKMNASISNAVPSGPTLLHPARVIDDQWGIDAITVADVTGDARADVVAYGNRPSPSQLSSRVAIYRQTVDGDIGAPIHSNVNSTIPSRPTGMIATPILGARPDLLIFGHRWLEIFPLAADGTAAAEPLRITPGTVVIDVAVRDLNGDGRPDLIVSGHDYDQPGTPLKIQRLLQTASGTFTVSQEVTFPFTPYGADGTLADIDSDGIIDVINGISTNDGFGFAYRLGLPDGSFGPLTSVTESAAQSFTFVRRVLVTDLDGDGLKDVIVSTGDGARVRFQVSPGNFTGPLLLPASAAITNVELVSAGDLDGNGLVDAIMWSNGYRHMQVDLQTAPRTFSAFGQYDVPSPGYPSFYGDTTAIADVNGDGRQDVLDLSNGLQVFYNARGSYPTLDSSLTTSVHVHDSGSVALLQWQHTVANSGPAVLDEGLLLQEIPVGFEFRGSDVPCAYFVRLVACAVPVLRASESTRITIAAEGISRRVDDRNVTSPAMVAVGGRPIDPNPDNDSTSTTTFVHAHPDALQAVANEVFVYESAGDTIVPVTNVPPESGLTRFMNYRLAGNNAPDNTGIASVLNGTVFSAPGQMGPSRIRITTRDGSSANLPLHFTVQFSDGGFGSGGGSTLTIVDDDGSDPRLTSSGAQPFEQWPPLFSSVTSLFTGATPTTVAIGDLDGDGRDDIAVAFQGVSFDPPYVQVWLQKADGSLAGAPLRWTAASRNGIASLAIGDVSGDGQPELVVPSFDQFLILRLVNGQLQAVDSAQVRAWKVALSDLNLDGFLDIVVADNDVQSFDGPEYWKKNVSIFYGNPQRTLDPTPDRFAMPYAGRNNLVVGRFNGDARPDIAITSGQGNFPSVSIAYQRADGMFDAPVGVWVAGPQHFDGLGFGDSITTGDFNGDGRTDFAIGSLVDPDAPSVWVYTGLHNDGFARPSQRLYAGPEGNLAAIDIDQDGYEDLLVDVAVLAGYPGSPMQAYLQNSSGKLLFAGTLPAVGSGQHTNWTQTIAVGDVDGDGEQDAVVLQTDTGRAGQILHSRAHVQTVQFSSLESVSVAAGSRARYRMRVTNNGTRTSLEIPFSWTVPAELNSGQIVAAKGACYIADSRAQCLLPQLAPGGYVDLMLTGTFNATGTYPMTLTAGPNGAYGQATLSATVTSSTGGGSGGAGSGGGGSSGGSGGGGGTGAGGGGGAVDLANVLLLALAALAALRGARIQPRSTGWAARETPITRRPKDSAVSTARHFARIGSIHKQLQKAEVLSGLC